MKKNNFIYFKELSNVERLKLAGFDTALFDEIQIEVLVTEINRRLGVFNRYLFVIGLVALSMHMSGITISQWKYPQYPVKQILEIKSSDGLFRLNGEVRSTKSMGSDSIDL